ncbi:hypothetical protein C8Q77DRAFT_1114341 [Trametes polyzona]|nr:hypothetical protein C8Q77DRAFT_1114341 [Trametes polyzona]
MYVAARWARGLVLVLGSGRLHASTRGGSARASVDTSKLCARATNREERGSSPARTRTESRLIARGCPAGQHVPTYRAIVGRGPAPYRTRRPPSGGRVRDDRPEAFALSGLALWSFDEYNPLQGSRERVFSDYVSEHMGTIRRTCRHADGPRLSFARAYARRAAAVS